MFSLSLPLLKMVDPSSKIFGLSEAVKNLSNHLKCFLSVLDKKK
jgi:hypothetical protein